MAPSAASSSHRPTPAQLNPDAVVELACKSASALTKSRLPQLPSSSAPSPAALAAPTRVRLNPASQTVQPEQLRTNGLLAALRILVPAAAHFVGPALVVGPGVQRASDRGVTRIGRLRAIEPVGIGGALRIARRRAGANDRARSSPPSRRGACQWRSSHRVSVRSWSCVLSCCERSYGARTARQ